MADATHTIGDFARLACRWEVLARKAGNVCPGREFPGLSVNDFLASADAIAPILDQAPHQPLGVTVLRAIEATRQGVSTNTNLGIVLLLAPLASVPLDQPLMPGLAQVLANTTVEDARNVYAAIRLANPSGLGDVKDQDVKDEPTLPLRDVMALAHERDLIAAQYADGFDFLLKLAAPDLIQFAAMGRSLEWAIVKLQLSILASSRDSHILRKCGAREARDVQMAARAIGDLDSPAGRQAYRDFDAYLRSDNHVRNPGTTADMIAAALFVALREGRIAPAAPFAWDGHPFDD